MAVALLIRLPLSCAKYANDSCTILEYNKKLKGCIEYRTRKLFPKLTLHYAAKYGFKVETPNVGWRVLNVMPDNQRRNALLQDSLSLHAYKYLMFASMTDIQPDEFLAAVWLRGKEYPEAKAHLAQILPPEASPALQRRPPEQDTVAVLLLSFSVHKCDTTH